MELSQESLVKELAESKQREAELRKDNKDLFVAVFRCKATEARLKTLEEREAELQAKYGIERSGRETIISCYRDERDQLARREAELQINYDSANLEIVNLVTRVKTLEDALRLVVDMNDCGASYVAQKALAAKEPKA